MGRPRSAANGDGTIYKQVDKNGKTKWIGQISLWVDGDGKAHRKSFYGKSRGEVKTKMDAYRQEFGQGIKMEEKERLFGEWFEAWLEEYKRPVIKTQTYQSYKILAATHILPALENIKLKNITPDHIQHILNTMQKSEKQLSTSTINRVRVLIKACLQQALINRYLTWNPVTAVSAPSVEYAEKRPLTAEEMDRFIAILSEDNRWEVAFYVLLGTGLRAGELLALQWQNIDFVKKQAFVEHTVTRINGEGLRLSTPKTKKSKSSIPLSDFIIKLLTNYKFKQDTGKAVSPLYNQGLNLVFATRDGNLIDPGNFRRVFSTYREKANISPDVTLHALRKTFATRLLEQGESLKTIQNLLRHSDVKTTANIYAFANDDMMQVATNVMSKLIQPAEKNETTVKQAKAYKIKRS